MRIVIRLILLFVLALIVAGISKLSLGTVALYTNKYHIQSSINFVVFCLFVLFVVLYYLIRVLINFRRLPLKIKRSRAKNSLLISRKYLNAAAVDFFAGRYNKCYDNALSSVKKEFNRDNKFLGYMLAFKSATLMRDKVKDAAMLDCLKDFSETKWQVAKLMVKADSLYETKQYGLCMDSLKNLLSIDGGHVAAKFLLMRVYLKLSNYTKAFKIFEEIKKSAIINDKELTKYLIQIATGLFNDLSDLDKINELYLKLTAYDRFNFIYVKFYLNALIKSQHYSNVLGFLKLNVNEASVQLIYGDIAIVLSKVLPLDLIHSLELMLEQTENKVSSIQKLTACSIIVIRQKKFDAAKDLLIKAISIKASQELCAYLAVVLQETRDSVSYQIHRDSLLNFLVK